MHGKPRDTLNRDTVNREMTVPGPRHYRYIYVPVVAIIQGGQKLSAYRRIGFISFGIVE